MTNSPSHSRSLSLSPTPSPSLVMNDTPSVEHVSGLPDIQMDLGEYRSFQVRVETAKIREPPLAIRLVSEAAVTRLEEEIKNKGFLTNVGTISVALVDNKLPQEQLANLEKDYLGGSVSSEVWLIDGRHRLRALRRVVASSKNLRESLAFITVTLWVPSNGHFLSPSELISLGCQVNQSSSTVKPHSFQDQVHAAVSLAKALMSSGERKLKSGTLAEALKKTRVLGRVLNIRQFQRYGHIACRLSSSGRCFKVFMDACDSHPKLGIVHLSHDYILDKTSDDEFELGMKCICAKVDGHISGSFQDTRDVFYGFMRNVFAMLCEYGQWMKTPWSELLGKEIVVGNQCTPVSDLVVRVISRFPGHTRSVEAAEKRSLSRLRGQLEKVAETKKEEIEAGATAQVSSGPKPSWAESLEATSSESQKASTSSSHSASSSAPEPRHPITKGVLPTVARRDNTASSAKHLGPPRADDSSKSALTPALGRAEKRRRTSYSHTIEVSEKSRPESKSSIGAPSALEEHLSGVGVPLVKGKGKKKTVVSRSEDRSVSDAFVAMGIEESESEGAPPKGFDDHLPEQLPLGWSLPPYCNSEPSEELQVSGNKWYQLVSMLPAFWDTAAASRDIPTLLDALCLPKGHRAHLAMQSLDLFQTNHLITFLRGAFNFHKSNPQLYRCSQGASTSKDLAAQVTDAQVWDFLRGADVRSTAVALKFFGCQRESLLTKGFCILEGFLADDEIPATISEGMNREAVGFFSRLHSAMMDSFPGEAEMKKMDDPAKSGWNRIINRDSGDDDRNFKKAGASRYMTTNSGVTKFVEQDADKVWMMAARAMLDARVGQAVAALGAWGNEDGRSCKMWTPKSGGRWLLTGKGCPRQQLHTDFPTGGSRSVDAMHGRGENAMDYNPGLFTICTGPDSVALWISPFSHYVFGLADQDTVYLTSKALRVIKVCVPPFSIFIGRGDVFHAGSGYDDNPEDGRALRYHLYFVPDGYSLLDSVHLMEDFQPDFIEEKKDENPYSCLKPLRRWELDELDRINKAKEEIIIGQHADGLTAGELRNLQKVKSLCDDRAMDKLLGLINVRNQEFFARQRSGRKLDGWILVDHRELHDRPRPRMRILGTQFLPLLRSKNPAASARSPDTDYNFDAVRGTFRRNQEQVTDYDLIAIPVHIPDRTHWALAVIDMRGMRFLYMDPLHGEDSNNSIVFIRRWLKEEVSSRGVEVQDVENWDVVTNPPFTPEQRDSWSCGIFVMFMAYFIELGLTPNFEQRHVRGLRKRTAYALATNRIPKNEF